MVAVQLTVRLYVQELDSLGLLWTSWQLTFDILITSLVMGMRTISVATTRNTRYIVFWTSPATDSAPHKSSTKKPTDSGSDSGPSRSVIIKGTSIFDSQAGGFKAPIEKSAAWGPDDDLTGEIEMKFIEIHHLWIGSTRFFLTTLYQVFYTIIKKKYPRSIAVYRPLSHLNVWEPGNPFIYQSFYTS